MQEVFQRVCERKCARSGDGGRRARAIVSGRGFAADERAAITRSHVAEQCSDRRVSIVPPTLRGACVVAATEGGEVAGGDFAFGDAGGRRRGFALALEVAAVLGDVGAGVLAHRRWQRGEHQVELMIGDALAIGVVAAGAGAGAGEQGCTEEQETGETSHERALLLVRARQSRAGEVARDACERAR